MVHQTQSTVYWDVPGINKDFGFYRPEHLGFFQSMKKIFILYDRDIDDVNFIIRLLSEMKI